MCNQNVRTAIAAAVATAVEAKCSFTARTIQHKLEKHAPMFEVSNEVGSLFNNGEFGRGWISIPVFRHSGTKQFTLYSFDQNVADENDYNFGKFNKGARKHTESFCDEEYDFGDAEDDEETVEPSLATCITDLDADAQDLENSPTVGDNCKADPEEEGEFLYGVITRVENSLTYASLKGFNGEFVGDTPIRKDSDGIWMFEGF